jgi:hypothetical protein
VSYFPQTFGIIFNNLCTFGCLSILCHSIIIIVYVPQLYILIMINHNFQSNLMSPWPCSSNCTVRHLHVPWDKYNPNTIVILTLDWIVNILSFIILTGPMFHLLACFMH